MARNYTLEDVETLRGKAGVSYEEAVALLDKYDGDIARALIELEKRGQLNASRPSARPTLDDIAAWCRKFWHKGLHTRLIVERKGETLASLTLLFLALMLVLGPYAFLAAALLTLLSGCSIRLQTEDMKNVTILNVAEDEEKPSADQASPEEAPESEAAQPTDEDDDGFSGVTIR